MEEQAIPPEKQTGTFYLVDGKRVHESDYKLAKSNKKPNKKTIKQTEKDDE